MSPSASPAVPLLAAHRVAFARNDEPVFGPLDFNVDRGETLLVEGDNGSGKTTLLRVLAGMLPGEGEIRFDGTPASRDSRNGRVLLLGHRLGMNDSLSARENLAFLTGLYGTHAGATVESALAAVGIEGWIPGSARKQRGRPRNDERGEIAPTTASFPSAFIRVHSRTEGS
jgi:heme exporter protein A